MKSHQTTALFDFIYAICSLETFLEFRPYFIKDEHQSGFENIKSTFDPDQCAAKVYIQRLQSAETANYLTSAELVIFELLSTYNQAMSFCQGKSKFAVHLQNFDIWVSHISRHIDKHHQCETPTAYSIYPYKRFTMWKELGSLVKEIANDSKKEDYNYIQNEIEQTKVQAIKALVNVDLHMKYYKKIIDMVHENHNKPYLKLVKSTHKKAELLDDDVKMIIRSTHEFIEQAFIELFFIYLLSTDNKLNVATLNMRLELAKLHHAVRFIDYDNDTNVKVQVPDDVNIKLMISQLV